MQPGEGLAAEVVQNARLVGSDGSRLNGGISELELLGVVVQVGIHLAEAAGLPRAGEILRLPARAAGEGLALHIGAGQAVHARQLDDQLVRARLEADGLVQRAEGSIHAKLALAAGADEHRLRLGQRAFAAQTDAASAVVHAPDGGIAPHALLAAAVDLQAVANFEIAGEPDPVAHGIIFLSMRSSDFFDAKSILGQFKSDQRLRKPALLQSHRDAP